jgi:lysophospholipid acyltransferase (LPLAT)-like uncharacterized protein
MMNETLYRALLNYGVPLGSGLYRLYFHTCRVREVGQEAALAAVDKGPVIIALWHFSFPFLVYYFRSRKFRKHESVLLVSASRDGEILARLMNRLGYRTARGSAAKKGAVQALRKMVRLIKEDGLHSAAVADGSRGPAQIAQRGVVHLAARTGATIVPVICGANRKIRFKSWDRTLLPLPFSRVTVFYGEPVFVPPRPDRETFEAKRAEVEAWLNELCRKAGDLI